MYRVQVMNKIAPAGLRRLDPGRYQVSKEETRYEGLILRSADLHGFDFPDELLAIARAGSGTNNIPIDQCNAPWHCGVQHPWRQRQRRQGTAHR